MTALQTPSEKTYALRMILLGEAGTGKTCLFHWIKYKVYRQLRILRSLVGSGQPIYLATGDETFHQKSSHTAKKAHSNVNNKYILMLF